MFAAWGRFVYRFRWLVLGFSALMLAASIVGLTHGGALQNNGSPTLEFARAGTLISSELPQPGGSSFDLIFQSDSLTATDPAFAAAMDAALAPLRADSRVDLVTTPYSSPKTASALLISRDGHAALAVIAVKDDFPTARGYYPELRKLVRSDQLSILATGNLAVSHDFDTILKADLQRAEVVSLPVAAILLLVVFATVVAALLPLGVGGLAVVGGLAGVGLLARATNVSTYATNIVTLIGLGVAIDYSLFMVNRFREELAAGRSVEDALARTMSTSGRAVTFSGLTVVIGLSGMLFFQGSFLASMGLAGAVVVAIAVLYALTFLASLLAILGPRVNRLRLPLPQRRAGRGAWHSLATEVMRRPWFVLVPVLALLALLASPFLHIRLANGDVSMLPPSAETRQATQVLTQQFPGHDLTTMTVVVRYASGTPLTSERVGALYGFSRGLAAIPDVEKVDGVVTLDPTLGRAQYQSMLSGPISQAPPAVQDAVRQSVGRDIVVLNVSTRQPAESDQARAIVRAIRAEQPPSGSQVLVGGLTAYDVDLLSFIVQRIPGAVLFVVLMTYLALFLLTGSLVLPLKAIVMNVVSISASFGALVWIFQQGHLSHLLNFTPSSIDPSVPVLLFCIVFGLSMDYEVILISRIQEEYRRTGDTTQAVAEGLERSGRLITGAAGIMVGVFAAFGLADVVLIKSIGLGLAIAVLIDATLVRALIVPAVMRLLGRANWWSPGPLHRLQRRINLGEPAGSAPEAA